MKIYLAARYSRKDEMEKHKTTLEKAFGCTVVSRWHAGSHQINDDESAFDQNVKFAEEDFIDLKSANIVFHFTEMPKTTKSRGGRHVELGLAIAWQKVNYIIGPRENIFHYLNMKQFDRLEDFLDADLIPRKNI